MADRSLNPPVHQSPVTSPTVTSHQSPVLQSAVTSRRSQVTFEVDDASREWLRYVRNDAKQSCHGEEPIPGEDAIYVTTAA